MDIEQQIRLNFLDEAREHLDLMESNLLGLTDTAIDPQKVDIILRSAHSVKGGSATMKFNTLSQIAHRIEDFLKILRVRYASVSVDVEVETLLLQTVDILTYLASLNRQQLLETDSQTSNFEQQKQLDRSVPIFEKLRSHLGDLEESDENALLMQNEDCDPAILIFEEGVDGILDRFENKFSELGITELSQELANTAQELIGFGKMANIEPFIQLCESIQEQIAIASPSEITSLAKEALKTWRRSHALVLRGSIEKLPTHLKGYDSINQNPINANDGFIETFDPEEAIALTHLQSAFEVETNQTNQFDPEEAIALTHLQSAFEVETPQTNQFDLEDPDTAIALSNLQSAFEVETNQTNQFDPEEAIALTHLQSAFEVETPQSESFDLEDPDTAIALSNLQSAFEIGNIEQKSTKIRSELENPKSFSPPIEQAEKMVRVPASQLKQFNTLFEQLVLNRNSINLRLEQLQNVVALMKQRISQMESSNTQLKQWYDRASIEGLLSEKEQPTSASVNLNSEKHPRFDSLEMDRYSEIHLICQEQIETIVQLQEVASDIELGVQEVDRSARDLHYTTKSMQGNVTRTQMLPFADAVKRCRRTIRDLNLKFDKKVNLKIIGERTLLDRTVIEAIADPLMHLLRNSFDHGIEDPQTRISKGKPKAGTITIQAKNQGTYSIITVSDDGGGICLDRIRDRVCQMGLSRSEIAQIPEPELLEFIFEPGFSTAKQVTELSGRGIGMDVVRTNLQEVRGDIRVDTKPDLGTTFTLSIPFSLSILRVALVEQSGIIFAIPANNIKELISCDTETILSSENTNNVNWNQKEIPLIEIEKILVYRRFHNNISLSDNPRINKNMTLILGEESSFVALKISRFWDEQESTIRSIDSPIPLPPGIISSVVFGDGKVIPLIDPTALIENGVSDRISSEPIENNKISTIKTILIVDDSINVRGYLSLTLEKAGYRVEQAKDGQEAVDKLIAGLAVQAVICDLEMPRLDGYGVLEEIKQRPEFTDLPIVMLTSRSNEKHRKLAINLGASAYFSKPYNEQQLLDTLERLIPFVENN